VLGIQKIARASFSNISVNGVVLLREKHRRRFHEYHRYFSCRHYDPTSARFLTKDPIGLRGGINPYTYCGNNPVNCVDPQGTEPISLTALGIGAGIGAVAGGTSAYLSGARDFNTIATASAIGAAAGATSVVAGAYAVGYAAGALINGAIGFTGNVATQAATGNGDINLTQAGIAFGTGAVGGVLGVAAGNAAFFGTSTIGNPLGLGAAQSAEAISSATASGLGSGILDVGSSSRTCH
jgi:RHS repeat-associated protein